MSAFLGRGSSTGLLAEQGNAELDVEQLEEPIEPPAPPLFPTTPKHHSEGTKRSPNSLSQSGNQTMTAVLSAHPHFSVFRKSASQDSLLHARAGEQDSPLSGAGGMSVRDLQDDGGEEVETLATPPSASPSASPSGKRETSGEGDTSSAGSSFHLSLDLDGGEVPSLNFGDHSSLSLSPSGSPAAPKSHTSSSSSSPYASPSPSTSHSFSAPAPASASTGSVRLVPDSPPTQRTPARQSQSLSRSQSRSSRSRTSSADSDLRRSTASSSGTGRVQFSPLSLCPSPLVGAPVLPPPPPLPFPAGEGEGEFAMLGTPEQRGSGFLPSTAGGGARGILKPPKTPGTGRSVRFSASTGLRSEAGEEEGAEDSPSVGAGGRSLSRLGLGGAGERVGLGFGGEETGAGYGGAAAEGGDDEEDVYPSSPSSSLGSGEREGTAPAEGFAPEQPEEAEVDVDVDVEDSSLLVSNSLLSRLHSLAPSPHSSFDLLPATVGEVPTIAVNPSTPLSLPVALPPTPAEEDEQEHEVEMEMEKTRELDSQLGGVGAGRDAHMLFDESHPFLHSHSASHLPSLTASISVLASSSSQISNATVLPAPSFAPASSAASNESTALAFPASSSSSADDTALFRFSGGDASLALNSFAGAGAAVSFGGESFAQLPSHLLHLPGQNGGAVRRALEEISEEDELERTAERTPRRSSPVSLAVVEGESEPLRASDMSSVGPSSPPSSPRTLAPATSLPTPSPTPSPPTPSVSPQPPAYTPLPPPPSSASNNSTSTSTSTSTSFYRQFMASRASLGGSQAAREEWERLERGEKGSPKDVGLGGSSSSRSSLAGSASAAPPAPPDAAVTVAAGVAAVTPRKASPPPAIQAKEDGEEREEEYEDDRSHFEGEESVYWSPMKDEGSTIRLVGGGAEEEDEEAEAGRESTVDVRSAWLSPIVEVSEPESNANTPYELSTSASRRARPSAPLPSQPSFAAALSSIPPPSPAPAPPATPSRAVARAPTTPGRSASKIPRPRNPITLSQNPFLLQLSRAAPVASGEPNKAAALLGDLFSAQADQLATSHSQRFILSSLVTNLQNEVEGKSRMVENLKRQVQEAREEVQEVERLALEWERRALSAPSAPIAAPSSLGANSPTARHERKKLAALEETVQLLADELETRVSEDSARRRFLEKELNRAQGEVERKERERRDAEIRLRHANAARERVEEERERERGEAERAGREAMEVKAAWRVDVEQRERALAALREQVAALKASPSGAAPLDETQLALEVERRVAAALSAQEREVALLRSELVSRDEALAALRETTRSQRDQLDAVQRVAGEERQRADLAYEELAAQLDSREADLAHAQDAHAGAQEEVDSLLERMDAVEAGRAAAEKALREKERELQLQVEQNAAALGAMAELDAHVGRLESDLAAQAGEVERAKRDAEQGRRDAADTLEKRDRVLAETERALGRARKEAETAKGEKDRLETLVGKLRRDSADREVKITKLKKRAAELEEDVFGLNIALDAKQQEASHWKRQMSSLKHERERAAAASLADSTTSAVPSTVSRHAFASISAASTSTVRRSNSTLSLSAKPKPHSTTPMPSRTSRASIARPADRLPASNATETEDDESAAEENESHDLTLPPSAYEATPSRAPAPLLRRSSSSRGLGLPRSKSSASVSDATRRRSGSREEAKKENEPPAPVLQARQERRREAVLA
ncbi:hypothetical protein JCM10213_003132 [Rhodosporidiobolus nylandii]